MQIQRLATGLLLLSLLHCGHAAGSGTDIKSYTGNAYDSGGRLLYRETHFIQDGSRLILYRCTDGRAFARKNVEGDGAAPNFDFSDGRDGYREGVRNTGNVREVFWRDGADKPLKQTAVAKTGAVVFDAGFDAYVRQHWTALERGDALRARFLVPSRLGAIGIRLQQREGAPAGFLDLGMRLDAWYGFAAPEFRLRYRKTGRWLSRFEGIGTIRNAAGSYPKLRIEFPDAPVVVPLSALQSARNAALASSCGAGM
ncbi:hypothetical protein [Thermomonas sp. HDW16]|uniref:hypothetical protein n=1 Tax=Thermomonas sp. HDW16 TaxID=2714945 RepID=UPI0014088BD5|nr:hypothetical protein [Thermomonas sp. HDW16]QIL20564.1 hypothetical protein G7079_07340 [Thermomonas sp. HDW16]